MSDKNVASPQHIVEQSPYSTPIATVLYEALVEATRRFGSSTHLCVFETTDDTPMHIYAVRLAGAEYCEQGKLSTGRVLPGDLDTLELADVHRVVRTIPNGPSSGNLLDDGFIEFVPEFDGEGRLARQDADPGDVHLFRLAIEKAGLPTTTTLSVRLPEAGKVSTVTLDETHPLPTHLRLGIDNHETRPFSFEYWASFEEGDHIFEAIDEFDIDEEYVRESAEKGELLALIDGRRYLPSRVVEVFADGIRTERATYHIESLAELMWLGGLIPATAPPTLSPLDIQPEELDVSTLRSPDDVVRLFQALDLNVPPSTIETTWSALVETYRLYGPENALTVYIGDGDLRAYGMHRTLLTGDVSDAHAVLVDGSHGINRDLRTKGMVYVEPAPEVDARRVVASERGFTVRLDPADPVRETVDVLVTLPGHDSFVLNTFRAEYQDEDGVVTRVVLPPDLHARSVCELRAASREVSCALSEGDEWFVSTSWEDIERTSDERMNRELDHDIAFLDVQSGDGYIPHVVQDIDVEENEVRFENARSGEWYSVSLDDLPGHVFEGRLLPPLVETQTVETADESARTKTASTNHR